MEPGTKTLSQEDTVKQNSKNNFGTMLENNFAAAGLAEGDRDIARQYLANEENSSLWIKFKEAYSKLENHFVAAGLAEGCQDTARRYMEQHLDQSEKSTIALVLNKMKQWSQSFQQTFTVAGLAEGDPDVARSYLNTDKSRKSGTQHSLKHFLATTGLKGVQYQYGLLAA